MKGLGRIVLVCVIFVSAMAAWASERAALGIAVAFAQGSTAPIDTDSPGGPRARPIDPDPPRGRLLPPSEPLPRPPRQGPASASRGEPVRPAIVESAPTVRAAAWALGAAVVGVVALAGAWMLRRRR